MAKVLACFKNACGAFGPAAVKLAEHIDVRIDCELTRRRDGMVNMAKGTADMHITSIDVAQRDMHITSIDMAQGYMHVELNEAHVDMLLVKQPMNLPIEQTIGSTPPIEQTTGSLTKLEVAVMVARRFREPEPEYLSFDMWLMQEFLACFTDFNVTWSVACIKDMDLEIKRMAQSKHRHEANIHVSSMWDADGYRAPNCGVCGGLHLKYSDLPSVLCECNMYNVLDSGMHGEGIVHMTHTEPATCGRVA